MSYAIQRPKRPLPDELYQQIAAAYRQAANPGKLIADESDIPKGTISRWIAEARKRGLLGPTTPGKVSGRKPHCPTCGRPL